MLDTTTPTAATSSLIVEQYRLELDMLNGGIERFRRMEEAAKKRGEAGAGGRYLLRRLVGDVTEATRAFIREASSGKAGVRHTAYPLILSVGAEEAAYLALRRVIHAVASETDGTPLQAVAVGVGRALQDELWMRRFAKENPELWRVTMGEVDEHSSDEARHAIARRMARKAELTEDMQWTEAARAHVGLKMIDLIRSATGIIETTLAYAGTSRAVHYVHLSAEAAERMAEVSDTAAALSPLLLPTIIPPKKWKGTRDGGYHSGLLPRMTLVKTRHKEALAELERTGLGAVLDAVNAVQETPWRINSRVLEVLQEALDTERAIGGLPAREAEVPPYPALADTDPDVKREWKRAAAEVYAGNRKAVAARLQVAFTLGIAKRFRDRDAIYFPHQLDFRGRIYPLPSLLHPQGPDYAKALLTFGRSYPIEDSVGAGWLMVSGAGRMGGGADHLVDGVPTPVDKCSLLHRMEWVEQNEEAILAVDADPWGPAYDFWTKADDPFQFLAWCFEWAAFKRHGWGYPSSIPVNLDGTCNGLQHYSAALRDPEGGAAVNLLPSAKPNDIYRVVADRTKELVMAFTRPNDPAIGRIPDLDKLRAFWGARGYDAKDMATAWLALGIDRNLVKRAVMTLPYGSTNYSAREFLEEAARKKLKKGVANPFTDATDAVAVSKAVFAATLWLQPLVWTAIGETVKAARQGMAWLQQCARVVCARGEPVKWRTPDGFLVQQTYRALDKRRIKTMIDGALVKLTLASETEAIDPKAQQQGVAPNWVHSMDAAALRMFVNIAKDNGLEDFSLIHDSYGAPAAKVELMLAALKEAFIHLYTDTDPVLEFYFDMLDQVDEEDIEKLPQPPVKGTLDISAVRKSDYFFA